jgi:CRP-like cAMP-binding protein
VLVSYGEPLIDVLAHFMRDPDEDLWVRRHIPATLAQIPSQKSADVLIAALEESDGFLRFKVIAALARLRRMDMALTFPKEPLEPLTITEGRQYFNYLSLYHNIFGPKGLPDNCLLAQALREKLERSKKRIYLLLGLMYPWKDITAAEWTLDHGEPRARASASEYLDNILTGQLRKQIIPVLEDLPIAEKVRRGNVLLKTRPRDLEETLLQLINDDDQVVASCAIDVVRQQAMWSLGDDVEHVLAHRDPHDWYVFEAASWALAERRMPAERRRELWLEPLPAAELAGRLRMLPLFASVTVDELFRIAGTSRQVRHEPGTMLLQENAVPETLHLLLDGAVTATSRDSAPRVIDAPAPLGFIEALQGRPVKEAMRAPGTAVTLVSSADEIRTLLSNNTELVRGLFSTLADRMETGRAPVHSTGNAAEFERLAKGGLLPIEKILALQRVPIFSQVTPEEMQPLAQATQRVAMTAGTQLFAESAPPTLWLVLTGEVSLTDSAGSEPIVARGGDIIGSYETMSGHPLGKSGEVLQSGIAIRTEADDLFELLGERPELLRQMFEGMFRLEERDRRGKR